MKKIMRWLVAGWMLCAGMGMGQGTESRFFRIVAPEQIDITGIYDGVITWDQRLGVEVTVEVSENLADPSGWRRYTGMQGDEMRGTVRVFDRDTPHGMVLIPGGTNAGTDPDFGAYSLTVESFYMDRTPVTKAQWDEVYAWATHADRGADVYSFDNAGRGKAADHPVVSVNWYDVVKWCNARSEMEGRTPVYSIPGQPVYRTGVPEENTDVSQDTSVSGYRIPTVRQYQYASRGGLVGKRFPWGDTVSHAQANYRANGDEAYCESSPAGLHPEYAVGSMPYTSTVGSFAANGYGLYDMVANVGEWCWDPSPCAPIRSIRSGSWNHNADHLRCGLARWYGRPEDACWFRGFRTVCPVEEDIRLVGRLAFGDVRIGASMSRMLTIRNDGDSALTVSSISYPDGFSGDWSGTIGPGLSELIEVVFAPQAEQFYGGNLTVVSNADRGVNTHPVSGTGVSETSVPSGMVLIPGGTNAGTVPEPDGGSYSLTVESFYMDTTPVTKAQWDDVYNWAVHVNRGADVYSFDNAGSGKAANHPVVEVSWYDAVKWCNARSEMEGRTPVYSIPDQSVYRSGRPSSHTDVVQTISNNGYRLPTVTEHQYASRGRLVGKRFPWGDTITHNQANYFSSTNRVYDISETRGHHPTYNDRVAPYTSPVGSFAPNGYGLYDMAGNVWNWCWDALDSRRARRAGGWCDGSAALRCRMVSWFSPDSANNRDSFRAVCR